MQSERATAQERTEMQGVQSRRRLRRTGGMRLLFSPARREGPDSQNLKTKLGGGRNCVIARKELIRFDQAMMNKTTADLDPLWGKVHVLKRRRDRAASVRSLFMSE